MSVSRTSTFFERYARLRSTSTTDVHGERLEYRYRALIERNRTLIHARTVLDLGSHDGRWMLAALHVGARHVVGIEGRQELVDRARSTFREYRVPDDRYEFIVGDCLTRIAELDPGAFDTVFCFGLLYHTLDQYHLLHAITALEPATLLIDSRVVPIDEAAIFLAFDDPRLEGAAIARAPGDEKVLVGVPTTLTLLLMLDHLGWRSEVLETLRPTTRVGAGIRDYREGRRITIVASRTEAAST